MEEVLDEGQDPIVEDEGSDEAEPKEEGPTIQDLAKEQGWNPEEEFSGHKDDWVDEVQYIRNSKPIQDTQRKHLKDNKRAIKNLEQGMMDLQEHNEQVQNAQSSRHRSEIAKLRKDRDKESLSIGYRVIPGVVESSIDLKTKAGFARRDRHADRLTPNRHCGIHCVGRRVDH